jgi:hypothetical protein
MLAKTRKTLIVTLGVAVAAVVASASLAYATTLPPGTTVTASLAPGTNMVFNGDINSLAITVTCTNFSGSGTIPQNSSNSLTLQNPPTISGCTDSTGHSDTITTNQNNGSWVLSVKGKKNPYSLTLQVPKAGATFTSTLLPSCTVTAGPKKPVKIKGKYDDSAGSDTVTNGKIATKGSGCTSGTATVNATVDFSPNPGPPPF